MIATVLFAAQVAAAVPAVVARARPDTGEGVSFRSLVVPETVYVGQQAIYQVGVFVSERVRERLRRNPEFVPPELRAMLAYDLPGGYTLFHQRRIGARTYDVHVFQRAIFPLASGRHVIAPAELTYALPLGSSFFSREESHVMRSDSAVVIVREPPTAGRPADWSGAVGAFRLTMRVESRDARVGDPLVMTLRVAGEGNVNLLPRPVLQLPWATAVPAGERVTIDSAPLTVRGAKEFDWIVTPRAAGAVMVPVLRYAYFDPTRHAYDVAVTAPETLSVRPGVAGTIADRAERRAPALPIRMAWRGERAPDVVWSPVYWGAVALVPLPAILLAGWTRRKRAQPDRRTTAAARLTDRLATVDEARRAFRAAMDERLAFVPGQLAAADDIARALRRCGVTSETAEEVARLLATVDEASFGGGPPDPRAVHRLRELYACVNLEAVTAAPPSASGAGTKRGPGGAARGAVRLLVATTALAGAIAASAAPTEPAARGFADGVTAYRQRRFVAARRLCADVTERAPRSADGWANLGTAAWATGDSALAAAAWQRALRLEPDADDVRDRLALLAAPTGGFLAWVPPVSSNALASLALVVWVAGWGALAWRARAAGRGARIRPLANTVIVASVLLGVAAGATEERQLAVDLAVVRGNIPLRAVPALGGDAAGQLVAGEIARVHERQGVWTRVDLDAARDGWIESDRLIPLAAR